MDKTATNELIDEILRSAEGTTLAGFMQRREHLLKQQMSVLVCVAKCEQRAQDKENAKKLADICARVATRRQYGISLLRTRPDRIQAMSSYAHVTGGPRW